MMEKKYGFGATIQIPSSKQDKAVLKAMNRMNDYKLPHKYVDYLEKRRKT